MQGNTRLKLLKNIFKNAGLATDLVNSLISKKQSEEKKEEIEIKPKEEYKQVPISVGSSAIVMAPPNVIKPDGSVDIVINFKGVNTPAHASATGRRAVMVSVYEPEGGQYKFGNYSQYNHNFVNGAVNKIITTLQKANPDKVIKRGKLTITGWSAGGSSLKQILANEDKVEGGVNEVIFSDALHAGLGNQMDAGLASVIDYARKAAKDPSKKITLISTGVVPGDSTGQTMASTYDTGKRVSEMVGASPVTIDRNYRGGDPASVSRSGGFEWVQLFPPGKYSVEEMKRQHRKAYEWGIRN